MEDKKHITIDISTSTLIRTLLILVVAALIYLLRDVALILVVALVLSSAVNPFIAELQRKKIPRVLGALIVYILLFGVVSLIIGLLIPPIATQIRELSQNFSTYWSRIITDFTQFQGSSIQRSFVDNLQKGLQSLQTNIGQTSASVVTTIASIFGGFFAFIGIIVITFYILIEEDAVKRFLRSVTPVRYQPYLFHLINRMQERLGQWLKGQLLLCLIIGILSYIGLSAVGVPYALVLALWAGLTEFIPYLGPFIGAVPAIFIALTTGGWVPALLVLGLYVVIQQLENHLIVPKVMEKTAGINPLVVIIVMYIGAKLAGILGILLAVPVALIVKVFMEDLVGKKEVTANKLET